MIDIAALVKEYGEIRAHLDAQDKVYADYKKPYNAQMELIQSSIHAAMLEQGIKSLKTDYGTPMLSEITNVKIKGDERDAYIDMCLDNWDAFGGEMLQIGSPKVDAVRSYMDEHDGAPPPHIEISTFLRFSIRKA